MVVLTSSDSVVTQEDRMDEKDDQHQKGHVLLLAVSVGSRKRQS